MKAETVLITRTEPGASKSAASAIERGYEAIVSPLARIDYAGTAPDLAGVDALAVTSRHGVRAFAALTDDRALPVFAVGGATAEAARRNGFASVHSADGDACDLARLIAAKLRPGACILHVRGDIVAGDLAGDLTARGFAVRSAAVYRTTPLDTLSAAARKALEARPGPILLVHSPAGGERLLAALKAAGIAPETQRAAAISRAAAEPLRAGGIGRVETASQPDDAGVLDAADRLRRDETPR